MPISSLLLKSTFTFLRLPLPNSVNLLDNTIIGEELAGGFNLQSDLSMVEKNAENIYFFFSKDDDIIPLSHLDKYQDKIKSAHFFVLENMNNHFNASQFPEIVDNIRNDLNLNK